MRLELDRTLEILDRVSEAMEEASCPRREGPFGLYDYKGYGDPIPHHVRDFRSYADPNYGRSVFRTKDPVEARRYYEDLTRRYIAMAAVQTALRELGIDLDLSAYARRPQLLGARRPSEESQLQLRSPEAGPGDKTPPGSP